MKHVCTLIAIALVLCTAPYSKAQSVLVSEYNNFSSPALEWSELIVVQDNLDMRGFIVTDNNGNQSGREGGVRFRNINYWKNVRAGTIIGLWHRNYQTNTPSDFDTSMADGRIMLAASDTSYFSPILFDIGNTFDVSLNLARVGDFIEVLNKDTVHIHAIGHKDDQAPGSFWYVMPAPKTNLLMLCEDKSSNRVYPGSSLAEYNGPNMEVRSQICATYITRTLPNKDCNTGASNAAFWHSLRQPLWTNPTMQTTASSNQVLLSWSSMTDPNPADALQGYLVVRDSGSTPFAPVDGRIYKAGERFGSAVVLANVGSLVNSFSDNIDLPCGVIYTYRVFAYRYTQDDEYGVNTPALSTRGRQYNRDSYAFHEALKQIGVGPKLQYAAGQTTFCEGSSLSISVPTQSGYSSQWMLNGTDISGETTESIIARTSGQYRLKLRNGQGCLVLTDSVDLTVNPLPGVEVFPKTMSLCTDSTTLLQATPNADFSYQWLFNGSAITGATDAVYLANQSGDFSVKVTNKISGCSNTSTSSTIKALHPDYSISTNAIIFADLADCVSYSDNSTSLSLTNNSTSDTVVLRVAEPLHFSVVSPSFPLTLAPGQSTKVVLRFTPTNSAQVNENLAFMSTPCGLTKTLSLSARKPGLGVGLTSNVSSKDFGTIAWCEQTTAMDSVILSVSQATTVSSINVDAPFSISAADMAGFTLGAGQSRVIKILFSSLGNPLQVGKKDLVVHFTAGACTDSIKVNLRGAYTLPQLLVNLAKVDFGVLDSCSQVTRDTVIEITNTSSMDIELQQLTESALSIVEITGSSTLTIPAGATVPVTLRFSPNGYTSVNKQVTFTALPCLDLSGFSYAGKRSGISLSSASSSVDFGDVQVCNGIQSTAKTLSLIVASLNGATAKVSDVRFSSPLFSSSLAAGQTLSAGSNNVTVNINSNATPTLGSFTETMFITMQPCDVQQQFTLSGRFVGQSILIENSNSKDTLLDFGTVDVNTPSTHSYTLRNNSTFAITLGSIPTQVGPYAITTAPASGSVLAPGQTLIVTAVFTPTQGGAASNVFKIPVVSPCTDSLQCQLHGVGRAQGVQPVPFHFRIGSYTANVGDVITIPIHVVGTSIANRALTEVHADFDYNTSLLRINNVVVGPSLSGFNSSFSPVLNGVHINATNGSVIADTGVAFNVSATVLLGNALSTPLFIDTSSVSISSAELTTSAPVNGDLTIKGSCQIGNRLIKVSGTVGLMVMSDNQTAGTITFAYETVGEQQTTIDIFNSLGERSCTLVDERTHAGVHEIELLTNRLAQGAYFVVMHSGISSHSLMIDIVR